MGTSGPFAGVYFDSWASGSVSLCDTSRRATGFDNPSKKRPLRINRRQTTAEKFPVNSCKTGYPANISLEK
jgi:hypothetical protein